jgi:D-alanyl-D-alanine carboxypeptidase
MKRIKKQYKFKNIITLTCLLLLLFSAFSSTPVHAASEEQIAEMEARKELPIQSNEQENWPVGPALGAQAALLIEANSNTILYAKNIDEILYPASTTKMLTGILIMEHCELNETMTFSTKAIESIRWGDSNMGANIGDELTVDQALHAILIGSANEAAYAMAEHISGDVDSFANLMNEKAKELGCKNTHFTNPSGLPDEDHYTTAYDLAVIAKEFFSYDYLCKISSTYSYEIPPQESEEPLEAIDPENPDEILEPEPTILRTKNKLLPNKEYAYDGLVGSKTGYTGDARQTLVSCARKDGMSLICVILKEESPFQFEDTVTLFNYGFSNFTNIPISTNETNYQFNFSVPFQSSYAIYGDAAPLISLSDKPYVTIPKISTFTSLESKIIFSSDFEDSTEPIAYIDYYYHGSSVGMLPISLEEHSSDYIVNHNSFFIENETDYYENNPSYYIQLDKIFFYIMIVVLPLVIIINLFSFFFKGSSSRFRKRMHRKRKSSSPYKKFRF